MFISEYVIICDSMSQMELLTDVINIPLTPAQKKKLEKLAHSSVLSPATFTRQHLVKTLKLQD